MSNLVNSKLAVCVAANPKYIYTYLDSFIQNLRTEGNYDGPLVVITNLFASKFLFKIMFQNNDKNIIFLKFKKTKFNKVTESKLEELETGSQPNRHITKRFQWEKLNLFDPKLKSWDYIFYLDINMTIHFDINPIFSELPVKKLFAKADRYPNYDKSLASQFDKTKPDFKILNKEFDLSSKKYFQTGVLYFDTNLIEEKTKYNLIKLSERFPITLTNEQAIMNLYFANTLNCYEELPEQTDGFINYFYWKIENKNIRITKQNTVQNK